MHSHYTNKLLNIEDVIIKKIHHADTFLKIYLETNPHVLAVVPLQNVFMITVIKLLRIYLFS